MPLIPTPRSCIQPSSTRARTKGGARKKMHEGQRVSVGEGAEETPSLSFARARSLLCASDLHGTVAKSRFRRSGRRGEKPDANRKQKQDIQENRLLGHLRRHGPYDSRTERERQQRLRMLLSFRHREGQYRQEPAPRRRIDDKRDRRCSGHRLSTARKQSSWPRSCRTAALINIAVEKPLFCR